MKYKKITGMILSVLMLQGCASIMNDSKQPVTINSDPEGAKIVVDGLTYTTPVTVNLKGKPQYYVTASKEGYEDTTGKIDSDIRIGSAIVGNIFNLSGLIGMGVDFLGTGAAYELIPELNIPLAKKEVTPLVSNKSGQ